MFLWRARGELDVAADVEPAEQPRLLEDNPTLAVDVEPAGFWFFKSGKTAQDRRLSASAWPEQRDQLAASHVQAQLRENRVIAEGLRESADFNGFHVAVLSVSVQRSERCSIARMPLSVILPHNASKSMAT